MFAEIRELGFGAASGIEAGALSEAELTSGETQGAAAVDGGQGDT